MHNRCINPPNFFLACNPILRAPIPIKRKSRKITRLLIPTLPSCYTLSSPPSAHVKHIAKQSGGVFLLFLGMCGPQNPLRFTSRRRRRRRRTVTLVEVAAVICLSKTAEEEGFDDNLFKIKSVFLTENFTKKSCNV